MEKDIQIHKSKRNWLCQSQKFKKKNKESKTAVNNHDKTHRRNLTTEQHKPLQKQGSSHVPGRLNRCACIIT